MQQKYTARQSVFGRNRKNALIKNLELYKYLLDSSVNHLATQIEMPRYQALSISTKRYQKRLINSRKILSKNVDLILLELKQLNNE